MKDVLSADLSGQAGQIPPLNQSRFYEFNR